MLGIVSEIGFLMRRQTPDQDQISILEHVSFALAVSSSPKSVGIVFSVLTGMGDVNRRGCRLAKTNLWRGYVVANSCEVLPCPL